MGPPPALFRQEASGPVGNLLRMAACAALGSVTQYYLIGRLPVLPATQIVITPRVGRNWTAFWVETVKVPPIRWSLKYEDVYLKAYDSIHEAQQHIRAWFEFLMEAQKV